MIRLPNPAAASSPMVLVADDTAIVRHLICQTLRSNGYDALAVADGEAALSLIGQCDFDAIITDLEMPHVGGDELIKAVRNEEDASLREIPIIVVSSRDDPATRVELRRLGADAFLAKPIDVHHLAKLAVNLIDTA